MVAPQQWNQLGARLVSLQEELKSLVAAQQAAQQAQQAQQAAEQAPAPAQAEDLAAELAALRGDITALAASVDALTQLAAGSPAAVLALRSAEVGARGRAGCHLVRFSCWADCVALS